MLGKNKMELKNLALNVLKFSKSIGSARDAGDTTGALILFYAYCDSMGSLMRPIEEKKTQGKYFRAFVREFVIPSHRFELNENDLWGARCGMLHTFSPYSDWSEKKEPRARKIQYLESPKQVKLCTEAMKAEGVEDLVFVDSYDLFNAFIDGVVEFTRKAESDKEFRNRVLFHADKFFANFQIKLPQPVGI